MEKPKDFRKNKSVFLKETKIPQKKLRYGFDLMGTMGVQGFEP